MRQSGKRRWGFFNTDPRERGIYTLAGSDRDRDAHSDERLDEPCNRHGTVFQCADGAFE